VFEWGERKQLEDSGRYFDARFGGIMGG